MENEIMMVEHLGPNGREMIPVEQVIEEVATEVATEVVAETAPVEETPAPKKRRKKTVEEK